MNEVRNAPYCVKCSVQMTPENSTLRPELFFCDKCLPDEFRPVVMVSSSPLLAPYDGNESEGMTMYGLTLTLAGKEIIEHAAAKEKEYRDLQEKYVREREEYQKVMSRFKDSPAPRADVQMKLPLLPAFSSVMNSSLRSYFYGDPVKFFTFVKTHVRQDAVYELSMDELDRLEWFK